MRIAAALAIVVAGLILVRWVAAVTASPVAAPPARSAYTSADLPSVRQSTSLDPTPEPEQEMAMAAAHEEAMRLGQEALVNDDLETARDFYFLASEALPGDPEAEARVRQVETVLDIDGRATAWREALDDVEELVPLAPRALRIARAYTEALVGAGREALVQGNTLRALRLCGEATERAPTRNDARVCAAQAAATATAIARATTPVISAATATPTPPPTTLTATPATSPSFATPPVVLDRPQ